MNFQERKYQLLTKKFEKNGQKIVNHQSGYLNLEVGEGRLPRLGVPEEFPQGDEQSIAEAISYVQKIAEQYPDEFAQWAAGANTLQKADGDSVRKATVNRSGQTSDPLNYPSNSIGSTPGAGKSVWTKDLDNSIDASKQAQLDRLVEGAEELLQQARMHEGHLRAKILHVSKL